MTVTLYSLFMALVWFSAFVLLGTLVRRRTGIVLCCRPILLLCLAVLTVARLVLPLEMPFTQVIRSTVYYPAAQDVLFAPLLGPLTLFSALLVVWGGGILVNGVWLTRDMLRDHQALATLHTEPAPAAQQCLDKLLQQAGVPGRVTLLVSSNLTRPQTTGLLHPMILLTTESAALPPEELEHVLTHELNHITSGDLWVKLLVRLLICLMWWNPCAYMLQKDLNTVLEFKCDVTSTRDLPEGSEDAYLQTLISTVRHIQHKKVSSAESHIIGMGFAGIPEPDLLEQRFQVVLTQRATPKQAPRIAFVAVALALFFLSYAVVLQPAYAPPDIEFEMKVTQETAYILAAKDGTYFLIYDDTLVEPIPIEALSIEPFCYLQIISEEST